MLWTDRIVAPVDGPQVINDSKTPSGRVHVGSLRGVLIHDVVFRSLVEKGVSARYRYGVDDFDPLDELPAGHREFFAPYLGTPLCNVPPPPGSDAPDIAAYFIDEFLGIFAELGVHPQIYRMRDVYRSGQFNDAIDTILRHAPAVRKIYAEVSNSRRSERWYPFQVICERCGRIGTTEVIDYDGKQVTYVCREDLVKWARGCGHSGKISPFDGRGKLPWKLEWVAKWVTFGVTIEGAGKDHSIRGGSRDVAEACLKAIFGIRPPLNIPYEFFLVGGARMSSSRGIGVSARDMASLLPPEILRFLVLRTQPQTAVNFTPDLDNLVKLFNEYDRYHAKYYAGPAGRPDERRVYELAQVGAPEGPYYTASFPLVVTLVQMPHIDPVAEFAKRKSAPLTEIELRHLRRRMDSARFWLDHFASEEERSELQAQLPQRAASLSVVQRAFLHVLAGRLEPLSQDQWEDDTLQATIFDAARLTPLPPAQAFEALYRVLLDRTSGPRAGSLLAVLEPDFVVRRCRDVPYSVSAFWAETAISPDSLLEWLDANRGEVDGMVISRQVLSGDTPADTGGQDGGAFQGSVVVEFRVSLRDGKTHLKRVRIDASPDTDADPERRLADFAARSLAIAQAATSKM